MKYALLQVPELALLIVALLLVRRWTDYQDWIFWTALALWIVKDAAMYPVYRKALSSNGPSDSVVGALGIARERIASSGYILVRGELWRARLREGAPAVEEGESVRVLGMEGLTLEIVPERTEE
jgi:membrane protein implicated in regulation of membrane protease activity